MNQRRADRAEGIQIFAGGRAEGNNYRTLDLYRNSQSGGKRSRRFGVYSGYEKEIL